MKQANAADLLSLRERRSVGSCTGARAGLFWKPRAACTSIVSENAERNYLLLVHDKVDMDDEDGRCLLDVICDPEALNDFLHGSETHGHVPEVQPPSQLSASEPPGLPSNSVDLDFLEDDDILGGSPSAGGGNNGFGGDNEPCDILQQSLAEANITEQSLQEAELDLGSFELTGLTQVMPTLADPSSLAVTTEPAVGVGISVGVGGQAQIFPGSAAGSAVQTGADVLGSVLAHPGLQLQPQVVNKAISVQPFVQQVGLGNVTLQPISGLQALPNGSPSGHLGIGQIQVLGQPTVMTINQPMQPILTKTVGGYQLHQSGTEIGVTSAPGGLGGQVLGSTGGLLIQGGKPAVESPAVNGAAVAVTAAGGTGTAVSTSAGLVGFGGSPAGTCVGAQPQAQPPGQIMQNVIIQRTPTPIQPKPPQGGALQPKLFKQPHQQHGATRGHAVQSEAKLMGVQQGSVPVSSAQNVAFLAGKAGANMVLGTSAPTQGTPYSQALFKQQALQAAGKPVSVHVLNQSGSIVIPSQTLLQGQNSQFLVPQLHAGGHILTSQGPGGQLIANQILTTNQNLNLGQVLTQQGHPAHIISGPIQLQPGQVTQPTLFQMPVTLGQTQAQAPGLIQGMPIQSPLTMLGQMEGLGPAVSLQAPPQHPTCGLLGTSGVTSCQPGEGVTVLGSSLDQASNPAQAPHPVLTVQTGPPVTVSSVVPSSSPSASSCSSSLSSLPPGGMTPLPTQFLAHQGSSMILSQESLQMFLQQDEQQESETTLVPSGCELVSAIVSASGPPPAASDGISIGHSLGPAHSEMAVNQLPSAGAQQQLKLQCASPSSVVATQPTPPSLSESPQASQASPLVLGQQVQSPHQQPPSQPPSRSCTPSSLPSLFIIHNQPAGSPHGQAPSIAPTQPVSFPQDTPPSSCSPKPPQVTPVQFQLVPPPTSSTLGPGLTQQAPIQGLTSEQQQTLHLIGAQLQTLSSIAQPSAQQKQLLDKLHQVQQNIILQSKQQTQLQPITANQFSVKQEATPPPVVTSSGSQSGPAQLVPVLQQASVLVNTPVSGSSEVKVFLGGPPAVGPVTTSLAQPLQPKQGVVGSMGTIPLGTGSLRIQVCGSGLTQLSTSQMLPAVQTQASTPKMPLVMEPSKEARMLEQLRKQQGSVLHPDYGSPFRSFEDSLLRLLPYHLYQGTRSSPEDYLKVDEEFESVSNQVLQRTQAMLDKYRLLLFEEAKRLGPSAEMVMIDRMFIQEEKVALNQDRLLAKERPDEYVAQIEGVSTNKLPPPPAEAGPTHPEPSAAAVPETPQASFSAATQLTPTRMVIKQGGGTTSVTWSSSITPARPTAPAADDDALPERSSKPPIKTYEARRRIGLKLKIKQEAGLSKVVHNTALDPVHTPTQSQPSPSPRQHRQSGSAQTPPPTHTVASVLSVAAATSPSRRAAASSSCPSSSLSSTQMNGTLEHQGGAVKRSPASTKTPPQITCRLPLRKTYRANVSPRRRPGVPGGGVSSPQHLPISLAPPPDSQSSSPTADRTVIASVKLEKRARQSSPCPPAWADTEQGGDDRERGASPGLIKELAEVEEVFYRGMIKNAHRRRSEEEDGEDNEDVGRKEERGGSGRSRRGNRKSREKGGGSSRTDRQVPGASSPPTEPSWDSSLPAKRRRSGSPDMDNASFSSGSPPPDDSLKEHLQRAIDGILNLQQGSSRTPGARAYPSQRSGGPSSGPHRPALPLSASPSLSVSQRSPLGGADGHSHNSKLVSRTSSR
ncbi:LOW QUALITY PROTEIN: BRD4-interacting chromatin-remodeling complex-associated protein [Brienomyrus brachyistius]|uniref:LOW QUALITY PROTEIN: BRD4-interacting chromatin-remodeling complex-associated protein n=1 Tax=Brienomyrus brachyistius TaxID=42636 RepID=UPI0020B19D42|nr:LOW QUALITY PROTEIN: BRD4-interacting chromatin-remodeling complex-associated protein [Brienomyrus brachyistius]